MNRTGTAESRLGKVAVKLSTETEDLNVDVDGSKDTKLIESCLWIANSHTEKLKVALAHVGDIIGDNEDITSFDISDVVTATVKSNESRSIIKKVAYGRTSGLTDTQIVNDLQKMLGDYIGMFSIPRSYSEIDNQMELIKHEFYVKMSHYLDRGNTSTVGF